MSELITKPSRTDIRLQLLATVSALTLMAVVTSQAKAEDADRPTVWIELGGQAERMSSSEDLVVPPFLASFDHLHLDPVLPIQRDPRYAVGGEGKVSFRPSGSDWVLSAAMRFGRANGGKSSQQQLPVQSFYGKTLLGKPSIGFQNPPYHINASAQSRESHAILDFQAGKEVGLGLFSAQDLSTLSVGVRFAQFSIHKNGGINGAPDFNHYGTQVKYGVGTTHHNYFSAFAVDRSFHGIGPSIAWDSSHAFLGDPERAAFSFDWGVNAAVLFGRQKVRGETSKTGEHYRTYFHINPFQGFYTAITGIASSYHHHTPINRSRSVVIPNLGGFAAMSLNFPNAKISVGYRADFFFGAMDDGTDVRRTEDIGFHGPYASISIGLGG
jgi:hypothetical protein